MYTKKRIEVKINGRGSETRTHTGRILSPLSLPLDYAPVELPFVDNLNSFVAVMLPPIEAFIHHCMSTVVLILNLTKNLIGFSIADGESVVEHVVSFLIIDSSYIRNEIMYTTKWGDRRVSSPQLRYHKPACIH